MRRNGSPVPAAPSSPPRGNRDPLPARPRLRVPSILVVGARGADRRQLAALLRRAGYDTREETDGAGALAMALESPPDLVIVGTLAAGMDAEEFTVRVRAEETLRRVPVLLLSSSRRGSDAKSIDDGSGQIPVAAMCSDPAAVLVVVARLFGRTSPPTLEIPAVAPRGPSAVTVRLPTLPLAAFLESLRSFHAEIGLLLEERIRASARREGRRALAGSMHRTEAMLDGVRIRLGTLLEHGTALAVGGEADALAAILPVASGELADSRVALLARFSGPGRQEVPLLALVPGLLPILPPPGLRGRPARALLPVLIPVAVAVPLPVLSAAIRSLGVPPPEFGTITLGPVALAGTGIPAVHLVAASGPLVLEVAPVVGRTRRVSSRERPRDGGGEFGGPISFDPADISAFHRIVAAGGPAGPEVPAADGVVACLPPGRRGGGRRDDPASPGGAAS